MSTCTCHSIREGHGGITYTLHILGVLCDHCEAAIADAEAQAAWDAMTPAEQIAARWNYARRKQTVLDLLKDDRWDQLLTATTDFHDAPTLFDKLRQGDRSQLNWTLRY